MADDNQSSQIQSDQLSDLTRLLLGTGSAAAGTYMASRYPLDVSQLKNTHYIVPPIVGRRAPVEPFKEIPDELRTSLMKSGHTVKPGEGLGLYLNRYQNPNQGGNHTLSGGVFYGLDNAEPNEYNAEGNNWGGSQLIKGYTWAKNPLFVETGGMGTLSNSALPGLFPHNHDDIYDLIRRNFRRPDLMQKFYTNQGITDFKLPPETVNLPRRSFPFALDTTIANEARKKGYDSVLGYTNEGFSGRDSIIPTEFFDLRENKYPGFSGQFSMYPKYKGQSK